jgi:hypothetical protein
VSQRRDVGSPLRGIRASGRLLPADTEGRRYELSFLDSDGRRRWRTVPGDLKAASGALADIKDKMRKGVRVVPSRLTVEEVAGAWLEAQESSDPARSRSTRAHSRPHPPRLGRRRIETVNIGDAAALVVAMRNGGSAPWTIHGTLTVSRGRWGNVMGQHRRRWRLIASAFWLTASPTLLVMAVLCLTSPVARWGPPPRRSRR